MIVHRFAATKPVKVIRTRNEVLPCAVAISANYISQHIQMWCKMSLVGEKSVIKDQQVLHFTED